MTRPHQSRKRNRRHERKQHPSPREEHCALASKATTDAERRAHLSTVRALNKAAMEMVKGNIPQTAGDGQYLVNSRTNAGVVYRVDVYAQRCDCANQHACWHLAACNVCDEVVAREDGDETPLLPHEIEAAYHSRENARVESLENEIDADDLTSIAFARSFDDINKVEADEIEADAKAVAHVTDEMVLRGIDELAKLDDVAYLIHPDTVAEIRKSIQQEYGMSSNHA